MINNKLLLHVKLDLKAWIMMILWQIIDIKTNKEYRHKKISPN